MLADEFFQAYGWSEGIGESIANMIQETQHGVPVVAHAYGAPNNCSDPLDKGIGIAVAAFLLAQGPVRTVVTLCLQTFWHIHTLFHYCFIAVHILPNKQLCGRG